VLHPEVGAVVPLVDDAYSVTVLEIETPDSAAFLNMSEFEICAIL
jgi:hypothetical protein